MWEVITDRDWPPQSRPTAPLGPTALEVIRSCPLRACFEASTGYPRRMTFEGRIGIAFHEVLESLVLDPPGGVAGGAIVEEARERFRRAVKRQRQLADENPREQTLPRSESRVQLAAEALVTAATKAGPAVLGRTVRSGGRRADSTEFEVALSEELGSVAVEVPVSSKDGLLRGRVDRAERTRSGVRLVDYKSAVRTDLPSRYERQVQLYARMWQDTFDEWPAGALVEYPLLGRSFTVSLDPETCEAAYREATVLTEHVQSEPDVLQLGTPGPTCKICDFRPWCRSFWNWQAEERSASEALERATLGLEGVVIEAVQKNGHTRVTLSWRNAAVTLVFPSQRFPHLSSVGAGDRLRVLDSRLGGLRHRPRATITDWTEIFTVLQ